MDKWEIQRTKTKDLAEAKVRARLIGIEFDQIFADARAGGLRKFSDADLASHAVDWICDFMGQLNTVSIVAGERMWLVNSNLAQGVKAKEQKVKDRRLPYSAGDLTALFGIDLYQGKPEWSARYWLPLLGLWTGARLEELGQLRLTDVGWEDGVDFLSIDPTSDGQRIKNESSRREVPLHAKVIQLGFLRHVDELRKRANSSYSPN